MAKGIAFYSSQSSFLFDGHNRRGAETVGPRFTDKETRPRKVVVHSRSRIRKEAESGLRPVVTENSGLREKGTTVAGWGATTITRRWSECFLRWSAVGYSCFEMGGRNKDNLKQEVQSILEKGRTVTPHPALSQTWNFLLLPASSAEAIARLQPPSSPLVWKRSGGGKGWSHWGE